MNYIELAAAALYEKTPIRLKGDAIMDVAGKPLDASLLNDCVSLVEKAVERAYARATEKRNRLAAAVDALLGEPGASEYIVSAVPAELPVKLEYSVVNNQARYMTGTILDDELKKGINALTGSRKGNNR